MKPREPRRNVMIAARLRHGNIWCDANILNISARGLMLRTAAPPARGTYVEVRRGPHVIIARVVWSGADRFGVSAQGRLAIETIINNAPGAAAAANDPGRQADRRARLRPDRLEWRLARSRETGRTMEFAWVAGIGVMLAALAYDVIGETLSRPLDQVAVRLSGTS